jgi:hypothetical protein
MTPGEFCGDDFATDGCRRLLAPSIKGAMWTINIMVTRYPSFETKVFPKVPAHSFAEEFFPSIAVLRVCGVGVLLA